MGRSSAGGRAGGRRSTARRAATAPAEPVRASPPTPTLASAILPRVWQGVGYRPLPDPALARGLFDFAAISWPAAPVLAWGAWLPGTASVAAPERIPAVATEGGDERLVGAVVAARHGADAFLHGPVVLTEDGPSEPLEVAAQLVAAALDHAAALGATTVFARPQGLDRVWVRFGFIPVPEVTLPAELAERRGGGLYAWRGGSALWTLREAEPA